MSQPFQGFCGFSYLNDNKYAAVERTVNFYPESNESTEETKYKIQLLPSPSNAAFSPLPVPAPFNQPGRGICEYRGRVFGVSGDCLWCIDDDGTQHSLFQPVQNDGKPVDMVPTGNGGNQIWVSSAGYGYVINANDPASSSVVTEIVPSGSGFLGAQSSTFQDGYVLVVNPGTNQFQISGNDTTPIGDCSLWSPVNISIQQGQADYLAAILSSREYVYIFGERTSQVYQNVGAAGIGGFPFQSYNETFIQTGLGALSSLVDTGGALLWVGQDDRGQRSVWRMDAFQPRRVSTFAVDQALASYPRTDDCVAFPFIWKGHLMVQFTFPTADKTWVYDLTESSLEGRPNAWHERNYTDFNGVQHCRPEQFHCYAYGRHLVLSAGGDGNPGAVYQYADSVQQFDDPVMLLRWSNDAGETWGFEYQIPLGKVGQFSKRVLRNRCGYGRDRVFWSRFAELGDCGVNSDGSQGLQAIVRDRISPHLFSGNKRVVYNRIEFELTRGIGAATPGAMSMGVALVGAELDFLVFGS